MTNERASWVRPEGDTSTDAVRTGWFAGVVGEGAFPGMWRAFLAIAPDNIRCLDARFDTRDQCEEFIREKVIPVAGEPL